MNKNQKGLSRRQILELSASFGGLVVAGGVGSLFAQNTKHQNTPSVTKGPFYPTIKLGATHLKC